MPAGYDAEVAELFRDFRAATSLSEGELAQRLSTRIEVVQALEQGALYALPPWAETYRVINNYGLLLNLDVRPLLRRVYAQVEAGIVELRPKPLPDVPFMTPPDGGDGGFHAAPEPRPMAQRPPPYQPPRPNAAHAPRTAAPVAPGPVPDRRPQPRPAPMPPRAPAPVQPPPAPRPAPPPLAEAPAAAPRPKSALVKWSVVGLLVLALGVGVWMLLEEPSLFGPSTSQSGAKPTGPGNPLDSDDPRNRKADRLPSPDGF
jgi:hypothetical protein